MYLFGFEVVISPARMDACPPQHLIGEHVPEAREDALVHEQGFDHAWAGKALFQHLGCETECIGAEVTDHFANLVPVRSEPQATEVSLILKDQLPVLEAEIDPVKAESRAFPGFPAKPAGHTQMDQEGGSSRAGQQPLPMPGGLLEPLALQPPYELVDWSAAHHDWVPDDHGREVFAGQVSGEQSARPCDVRQFRHGSQLPGPGHA